MWAEFAWRVAASFAVLSALRSGGSEVDLDACFLGGVASMLPFSAACGAEELG